MTARERRVLARLALVCAVAIGLVALHGLLASDRSFLAWGIGQHVLAMGVVLAVATRRVRARLLPLAMVLTIVLVGTAIAMGAVELSGAGRFVRVRGPFTNPNLFAAAIVTMWGAWVGLRRGRVAFFAAPAVGLAVAFTASRTALLALGSSLAVLAVLMAARRLSSRRRVVVAGLAILALVAIGAAAVVTTNVGDEALDGAKRSSLSARFDPRSWTEDRNVQRRLEGYRIARDMIAERPALGAGSGTFADRYAETTGSAWESHAHNAALHLLAEFGWLGLVAALLPTLVLFAWVLRAAPRRALPLVVVVVVLNSFDYTWFFGPEFVPTWAALASLVFEGRSVGPADVAER